MSARHLVDTFAFARTSSFTVKGLLAGMMLAACVQPRPSDTGLAPVDSGADAGAGAADGSVVVDAGSGSSDGGDAGLEPEGVVFALLDPGDDAVRVRSYLSRAEVDGVAWRATWSQVEPSDGVWSWSLLDATLDEAASAGKLVTIHLGASIGGWPLWLTAASAQTYTASTPHGSVTDPVPWDDVFLARYARLMQSLSAHLEGRGAMAQVWAVSVGAPVSEMSLVGCNQGQLGGNPTAVAYDRAKYLAAWSASARAVLAAFPASRVVISAPVPTICRPDTDGEAFFLELMTPLSSAAVFAADLKATGSQRVEQVHDSLRSRSLLLQTVWSSENDPTNRLAGSLSAAVCAGRSLGARYVELYKADLDSAAPAIQRAVRQARGQESCP